MKEQLRLKIFKLYFCVLTTPLIGVNRHGIVDSPRLVRSNSYCVRI